MDTKEEKQNQFEWWITCIPDKISELKKRLPDLVSKDLDFTVHSVIILENYLLKNYNQEKLRNDKEFWDCCASYVGKVYRTNVPNSEWYIELDDVKNIFYNKPALRIKNKVDFPPHSYVMAALDRNKGNFIFTVINKHKELGALTK